MPTKQESMRCARRMLPSAMWGLALTALASTPTSADDGAISNVGGAVALLQQESDVRMVAEKVVVRVSRDRALVTCEFEFRNEGAADTVLIGFPDQSYSPEGALPMSEFQSWVDGVAVPCERLPDANGMRPDDGQHAWWWTKRVYFPAGATRVIRDRYVGGLGGDVSGQESFEYILWTGASWKDSIGLAEIEVRLEGIPPGWLTRIEPPAQRNGRVIRWTLRNFEPGAGERVSLSWWPPRARARWERSLHETIAPPTP